MGVKVIEHNGGKRTDKVGEKTFISVVTVRPSFGAENTTQIGAAGPFCVTQIIPPAVFSIYFDTKSRYLQNIQVRFSHNIYTGSLWWTPPHCGPEFGDISDNFEGFLSDFSVLGKFFLGGATLSNQWLIIVCLYN